MRVSGRSAPAETGIGTKMERERAPPVSLRCDEPSMQQCPGVSPPVRVEASRMKSCTRMSNQSSNASKSAAAPSADADTPGRKKHNDNDEQDGDHGRGYPKPNKPRPASARPTEGHGMSSALIASLLRPTVACC